MDEDALRKIEDYIEKELKNPLVFVGVWILHIICVITSPLCLVGLHWWINTDYWYWTETKVRRICMRCGKHGK